MADVTIDKDTLDKLVAAVSAQSAPKADAVDAMDHAAKGVTGAAGGAIAATAVAVPALTWGLGMVGAAALAPAWLPAAAALAGGYYGYKWMTGK